MDAESEGRKPKPKTNAKKKPAKKRKRGRPRKNVLTRFIETRDSRKVLGTSWATIKSMWDSMELQREGNGRICPWSMYSLERTIHIRCNRDGRHAWFVVKRRTREWMHGVDVLLRRRTVCLELSNRWSSGPEMVSMGLWNTQSGEIVCFPVRKRRKNKRYDPCPIRDGFSWDMFDESNDLRFCAQVFSQRTLPPEPRRLTNGKRKEKGLSSGGKTHPSHSSGEA